MSCVSFLSDIFYKISWKDFFDGVYKASVVTIAFSNLLFARKIFSHNDQKDDYKTEKERKIKWLTTLILDHNLVNFYNFFENLDAALEKFKDSSSTVDKTSVNSEIGDEFIVFRRKFIDLLLAVDKDLYDRVLSHSDLLQDKITNIIFDDGINLSHAPKFNECFEEIITTAKTSIINEIFNYKG